jgi:MFS family permease
MRRQIVMGAVCAAMLAGCKVGPNYKRPDVAAPPQFRAADAAAPCDEGVDLAGYTLAGATRIPHYWILVLSLLFIGIAIQAVQVNMVPLLGTHGMPPQTATTVQASLWIAIVFGRLSTGWLMDRFFAPRVAICYMLAPILGLILLATQSSMGTSLVAAICMGLASGAEIDVIAYLVSRYFGLRYYSRIYGTFYATYGVAAFIGPYYASRIATAAGNDYTPALWGCLGALALGTALMFLLPRFPRELPTAS